MTPGRASYEGTMPARPGTRGGVARVSEVRVIGRLAS